MDLDVAALQHAGSQHVSVGQRDTEAVVGTRFAVIENDDMITDLAVQVSLGGAADITTGSVGVDLSIPGDRQTAHMQFDIVVDKVHVPKELVVLASRDQTEVGVVIGIVDHKSPASGEVARFRNDVGICERARHHHQPR